MKQVCAEIEFNKSFLVRPTLLLKYDQIKIDQTDYDEILLRGSESAWNRIIRENLLFLEDQGMVKKVSYAESITEREKKFIFTKGDEIVNGLNKETKQKLLLHAWSDFIKYIKIKMSYVDKNTSFYRNQYFFLRGCENDFKSIQNAEWDTDLQDFILKQCFWKSCASIIASRCVASSNLHMAKEYEPFVSLIHTKNNYYHDSNIHKIDQLIEYAYELALPSVSIDTYDHKYAFIKLRESTLGKYKELCSKLEEILLLSQGSGNDVSVAKDFLKDQWEYGLKSLTPHYNRFSKIIETLLFLVDISIKYWNLNIPDLGDKIKGVATKRFDQKLNLLKNSEVEWQAVFCNLFNESEIKKIDNEINKNHYSGNEGSLDYWRNNFGKLPWYAAS